MTLHRVNARRDANEKLVVAYLKARGAMVERLSGRRLPDLLVGWCGRWLLLECKTKKAGLNEGQAEFQKEANRRGLPGFTVRSIEDAKEILDTQSRLTAQHGR